MLIYPQNTAEKLGFDLIREATAEGARSEMGLEEIRSLQPVTSPTIIRRDLDLTREMMHLIGSGNPPSLEHPHDIRPALKHSKAQGSVLEARALLEVRQFASTCRILKNFFKDRDESLPRLSELAKGLIPLKNLEDDIEKVISDQGDVKDSASPELRQIRKSLNSRKNELRSAMNRIIRQFAKDGYLAEQEAAIRNGRLVIQVKAEHKRKINGFIQDVSATGQTVYLEPAETLNINNDIRELEKQEYREIEKLLRALTASVGAQREYLWDNIRLIGQFDALMAKAAFSIKMKGAIPEISAGRGLRLMEAFNPVLLMRQKSSTKQQGSTVVPLWLELEENEAGLLITGPNAGGKSVMLKTVGLCALMMQSGFAIPAREDSSLPVFDALFLDMGDEQSIDDDLSTFSSRLRWIRETTAQATSESLVLVDEAGTGTDPEEGAALYQAFLEVLHKKKCTVLVTTHHGSLKVFAHEHEGFVNGSMEFDQKNLSPTYHFRKGMPGSSYAFEIARRTGVQDEILTIATAHVGESKNRMESLINEMEKRSQEAEKLRLEFSAEKRKAERLRVEYEQRLTTLNNERDKLRQKALREAKDVMLQANARIEEAVRQIHESGGDKEEIKRIRKEVEAGRKDVEVRLDQTEGRIRSKLRTYKEPPKIGDAVKFLDSESVGELIETDGKKATVDVNGLRIKTKFKNLVKTDKPKAKKNAGYTLTASETPAINAAPVSPRLDIRGMRGDEAVREITWFIDRALTSGLKILEIIHGKGDGILRKIVQSELAKRKEVVRAEQAPWEQGGPGCTVVELR